MTPVPGCDQAQDVWAVECDGEPIQLAWEWTEIRPQVVALFDPMSILCNVSLIDGKGHALARSKRMLHLNTVIHRLDWRETLGWRQTNRGAALLA